MKSVVKCAMFLLAIVSFSLADDNDFYNDTQNYELNGSKTIRIDGEVSTPINVDISKLQMYSVNVVETGFSGDSTRFIGAYKYTGYSLFDILKNVKLKKKNADKFPRVVDLFVIVQNDKGEKVVFSWGEIFYPKVLHRIIIAKYCSPILPKYTKKNYPIPKHTKLVCANDLISVRNIENPSKITIISSPLPFFEQSEKSYSPQIDIYDFHRKRVDAIEKISDTMSRYEYRAVFYGKGRGFHRIDNFVGVPLIDVIEKYITINSRNLMTGYITISAVDGYRVTFSLSELFNRDDFAEILLLPHKEDNGDWTFSIFPAPDFFSDRTIKYISEIHFNRF